MEDFKYYTLFGVNLKHDKDMIPYFERDFLLRWTSNEKKGAELASAISKDEIFKTSENEAILLAGIGNEAYSLKGIKMRMMFCPEISAHLFRTEFPLEDEWINILLESANVSDCGKKQLADSKVNL